MPTCHLFYRGMLVNHFSGLLPKSSMNSLIESTLEIYQHMDDEQVARLWEEERRKELVTCLVSTSLGGRRRMCSH